jgi:serine protease Do
VLTNNHVVEGADELKVVLHNDRELEAEVVGTDPKTDLAVIRVKGADKIEAFVPATLGNSDELEVGEWIMAVGAPFGLKQTVSAGIVSAIGRANMGIVDYEDFIQTDAAINPGNSGGPLVRLDGKVVGINTAIFSRSGGYQGIGFAIPINLANSVVSQLIDQGKVVRGYLGVFIGALSEELAKSFGYTGKGGVLVQDVSDDGPAKKAGLVSGDIIVERDGRPVNDVAAFRNAIAATPPGAKVPLVVFRSGKRVNVTVELAPLPSEGEAGKLGSATPSSEPRLGIALQDVTPELKQRLGLATDKGALVASVEPGSPAQESGLAMGDLITQVGNTHVASAEQAKQALSKAPANRPLPLRIVREGRGLFLIVPARK